MEDSDTEWSDSDQPSTADAVESSPAEPLTPILWIDQKLDHGFEDWYTREIPILKYQEDQLAAFPMLQDRVDAYNQEALRSISASVMLASGYRNQMLGLLRDVEDTLISQKTRFEQTLNSGGPPSSEQIEWVRTRVGLINWMTQVCDEAKGYINGFFVSDKKLKDRSPQDEPFSDARLTIREPGEE